jgi:toxin ParE1/3/4
VLPVIWKRRALSDAARLTSYIADRNPDAAQSLKDALEQSAERLGAHPYLHRVGREPGTRESVVHPNYILIYRVEADAVRVLRVLHARQQYP